MTGEVHFARRYRFSASHRLNVEAWSASDNRQAFGKCNNPHGHGHNYTLEVMMAGPVEEETGMVVNMVALDALVKERVLDRFDVQNLNLDSLFAVEVSSTENLCRVVWQLLNEAATIQSFGHARLKRVRIEETSNNYFEYAGQASGRSAGNEVDSD